MAVNFIRIRVNPARMNVKNARINVNHVRICVKKASKHVNKTSKQVKQIRMNVKVERKRVKFIIVSDNPPILTDKKDPLMNNEIQAHFAGAKRQLHLQKELVLQYIISSSSIIHQDNQNLKQNAQNGNR